MTTTLLLSFLLGLTIPSTSIAAPTSGSNCGTTSHPHDCSGRTTIDEPSWASVLANAGSLPTEIEATCYAVDDQSYNDEFMNYVWQSAAFTTNLQSSSYCVDGDGKSQDQKNCATGNNDFGYWWKDVLHKNVSDTVKATCLSSMTDTEWTDYSGDNAGNWNDARFELDGGPDGNGPNFNFHMGYQAGKGQTRHAPIWKDDAAQFTTCVTQAIEIVSNGLFTFKWMTKDWKTTNSGCYLDS